MQFEVVYAMPDKVWRRTVEVAPGSTAANLYARSELAAVVADAPIQLGVFGRKVDASHVMQRGERLELYRPLVADPKQRRRRRAQSGR